MRRGGGFAAASPPRTALFVRARPKYICKLFIYRGPVRDLKTRAWLDRLARRRDAAVASDLVALGPPSQHRVGLLRRVDHRAASRTAGGTPSPRNTETAWRCRHGPLAPGTTVHVLRDSGGSSFCAFEDLLQGPLAAIEGSARATGSRRDRPGPRHLRAHALLMFQSFVCLRLPLGPLVFLHHALRQWFV